jgi:hypothetical protein
VVYSSLPDRLAAQAGRDERHGVDQALVVAIIQVGDAADDAGESGLGERALQRGQPVPQRCQVSAVLG